MKKFTFSSLFVVLAMLLVSCNAPAQDFNEGKHYLKLKSAQADGGSKEVEVIEFFWYGCGHCYTFEPHVNKWLAKKPSNVKFTRVPAIFNAKWELHAKAYYALESLNAIDKAHEAIFTGHHTKKKPIDTAEQLASIVATAGVEKEAFLNAMRSFSVQVKTSRAKQLMAAYRIQGVPAVAVNGQYITGARQAGTYPKLTEVMDFLVEKEAKRKNISLK